MDLDAESAKMRALVIRRRSRASDIGKRPLARSVGRFEPALGYVKGVLAIASQSLTEDGYACELRAASERGATRKKIQLRVGRQHSPVPEAPICHTLKIYLTQAAHIDVIFDICHGVGESGELSLEASFSAFDEDLHADRFAQLVVAFIERFD
ncbi:hypothetical protein [Pigmentiphaga litoralis]|uniref:hypothetical protein n=1 Tax=Pigmentiphaga litoralis TaxID=516702 RepID=UPI003B42E093